MLKMLTPFFLISVNRALGHSIPVEDEAALADADIDRI
jgi:hypothetical protein